jgi:hypothetical protein
MNPLTAGKGTEQLLSDGLWCRVVQEDECPTGAIHAARPNYLAADVSIPQHEPVTLSGRKLDPASGGREIGDAAKHAAQGNYGNWEVAEWRLGGFDEKNWATRRTRRDAP